MGKKDRSIKIGEKIDLHLGKGPFYRTMVEDITRDGRIYISAPLYRGIPIPMRRGQELEVYYYPPNERYRVFARVHDFYITGSLRLIALDLLSPPEKQQQRSSFRFQTKVKTVVSRSAPVPQAKEAPETLYTVDLSETGIQLRADRDYNENEKINIRIYLEGEGSAEEPVEVLGRIRRTGIDTIKNMRYVGVEFLGLSDEARKQIAKYLLKEQQKTILQQKLVEDE